MIEIEKKKLIDGFIKLTLFKVWVPFFKIYERSWYVIIT